MDAVATARFIDGLVVTRRQKAGILREYLRNVGEELSEPIRTAADAYAEFL